MTTTEPLAEPLTSEVSRLIAAELRAEMGRQGVSQRELSRRMGVPQPRVNTRVGVHASVELALVDVLAMTRALGLSAEGFLAPLLPRLDSNQQPSGYLFAEVNPSTSRLWWPGAANDETLADVVDIATRRAS